METISTGANYSIIDCIKDIRTKDWFAWNNLMPPGPNSFHVKGLVEVPNPGVIAKLEYRAPQGINPQILLLDLVLIQKPAVWPRILSWKEAGYDTIGVELKYTNVNIFCSDHMIKDMKVIDIH